MNRTRLVVLTGLVVTFTATAATPALASIDRNHEACVVLAQDPQGDTTKDYCISW